MGDDLGDEWWAHEGKSGTLLNSSVFNFLAFVRLVVRELSVRPDKLTGDVCCQLTLEMPVCYS